MTTHSPGPWEIGGRYGLYLDEVVDANGNFVCMVRTRNAYPKATHEALFDLPEGQANARLVASAPALLSRVALLEEAARDLLEIGPNHQLYEFRRTRLMQALEAKA